GAASSASSGSCSSGGHEAASVAIVCTRSILTEIDDLVIMRAGRHRSPSIREEAPAPEILKDQPEVLFVCVHNAGRSQMAAGLLQLRSEGRINVRSAGSAPGEEINPN